MFRNAFIASIVLLMVSLTASPSDAACGGVSPNRTAGNFTDFSDCASNYTEGDTITITSNITMTGGLTFANGGVTVRAATRCGVTLSHNAGAATLLTFSRDLTHDTTLQNIRFNEGASHTGGIYVKTTGPAPPATGYNPIILDNICQIFTSGNLAEGIAQQSVGGVVIRGSTFDASGPGNTCVDSGGRCDQAINFTADAGTASWTLPPTIGSADYDGLQNSYVENCEFIQFLNQAFDVSANARVVFRYNTMNESAGASHGADTGQFGARHAEYYNNMLIHVYYGDNPTCNQTFPVSRALSARGGTFVITANISQIDNDPCWANAARNVQLEIQNLRRAGTQYPCWGAGPSTPVDVKDRTYINLTYPAYHQVGRGTYDGSDPATSTGVLDPGYMWGQTGAGLALVMTATDYAPNECGPGAAAIGDYVAENRDYYLSARPGYTPYPYPWQEAANIRYRVRVTP